MRTSENGGGGEDRRHGGKNDNYFREFLLVCAASGARQYWLDINLRGVVAVLRFFLQASAEIGRLRKQQKCRSAFITEVTLPRRATSRCADRWRHELNGAPRLGSPIVALVCPAVEQMAAPSQSLCLSTLGCPHSSGGGARKPRAASFCAPSQVVSVWMGGLSRVRA